MALDYREQQAGSSTVAAPGGGGAAAGRPRPTTGAIASIDSPFVHDAPVAIYAVDLDGRILTWNRAAERLFGWSADEVLGRQVPFVPDDEKVQAVASLSRLLAGRSVRSAEYHPVRKDGTRLTVLSSATLVTDDFGEPGAIIAFAVDITAQRSAVDAVAEAERKWRVLLESTNDTVTVVDARGRVTQTTGEFLDVLGYETDWWDGRVGFDLIHPDERAHAEESFRWILDHPGEPLTDVFRTRHHDGRWELIEYTVVNKLDDPVVGGVVVTTHNVTGVRLAEALLSDEAGVLELIARNAPLGTIFDEVVRMVEFHTGGQAGIFLLDTSVPHAERVRAGESLVELHRRTASTGGPIACREAVNQARPVLIADVRTHPLTRDVADQFVSAGFMSSWSYPIMETDQTDVLGTIAIYHSTAREPTEREQDVVGVATHLTAIALERDRVQRRLEHQARHDQLTDLPNRWAIVDQLDRALTGAPRAGARVAVLLIDLDRFKVVNDSLGHEAGDAVLVSFGERLRSLVDRRYFVGHFGADEFVVVMDDVHDVEDVHRVASRLDLALSEPFTVTIPNGVGDHAIYVSTSIGVALSTDGSITGHQLLQQADTAMFRAKDRGRDRLEVFDDAMQTKATEQLRVDRELRLAVERAELRLHYQPKIDLATGAVDGVEALLRWEHPERGLVPPGEFIGLAEETGLIVRIGAWVIDEAVRQAKAWVERVDTVEAMNVAVNLSARQLTAQDLVSTVSRVLERYRWPAEALTLELTESILIDDSESALAVLLQLKALGVKLAIDDFGTGYSSLGYLHRFPFDIVKVDRAFVAALGPDGEGSAVATAVMHMARALGLTTVAEGVETPEQLAGLRMLGCDRAQGFYFAEALPAPALTALLLNDPRW